MSLNSFSSANKDVEKKYLDIRANSVSIGSIGTLNTQTYQPVITIALNDGVINQAFPANYTCNGNTLRINGIVNMTSTSISSNNFRIFLTNLPTELSSSFLNKDSFCSGYLSEFGTNTLTNTGSIVSCVWNTNQLEVTIFYSKQNTSVTQYKIRYFLEITK